MYIQSILQNWKEAMAMKKGEMGVGTLIIFIAMLLVAAVAAGVLIQTSSSLQEKSLSTGQQARSQISTNAQVVEVSATDGSNTNLTDFSQIIKLSPGSDPIKLDDVIFTFNTDDATSTLKYRGTDSVCEKNNQDGYNTWSEETFGGMRFNINEIMDSSDNTVMGFQSDEDVDIEIDLDRDGFTDRIRTCGHDDENSVCPDKYVDGSYLQINLSNYGNNKLLYVRMVNDDGTIVNLGNSGETFNFTRLNITDDKGNYYGFIKGWRSDAESEGYISSYDENVWFEFFSPERLENDYDDDNKDDFFGFNSTHAFIFLSNAGTFIYPLGADLRNPGETINLQETIENETDRFGEILIQGEIQEENIIPSDATIEITPRRLHEGYFSAIYETTGTNHRPGNLARGDVLRLCYEAPGEVTEDQRVRLNFIPKIGTPTLTEFITPDVISTTRVYLYP